MLDLSKYEGHTRNWHLGVRRDIIDIDNSYLEPHGIYLPEKMLDADAELIADAPLILDELIRTRNIVNNALFDLCNKSEDLRELLHTLREDLE